LATDNRPVTAELGWLYIDWSILKLYLTLLVPKDVKCIERLQDHIQWRAFIFA